VKPHVSEDVRLYMVGLKSDMQEKRKVTYERAVEMAKEEKIHSFFETSGKTGYNVEELFASVAKELYA
jgi:GTPase SAR1 family protein